MPIALHQAHYRFGTNDGTVSTHGWLADIDTPITLDPTYGTFLLRFAIWEYDGASGTADNTVQQFQYRTAGGSWTNITTTSSYVRSVTTTVFADTDSCTPARLGAWGSFDTTNQGCTHTGVSGGTQNDIPQGGSSETIVALQLVASDLGTGSSLEFRVSTSPTAIAVYDVYPSLTVNEPSSSESVSPSRSASLSVSASGSLSPSTSESVSGSASISESRSESRSASPTEAPTSAYGRPTADLSKGTWTASTGSDLYAMIDEALGPNDTDYIRSAATPVDDTAKLRITGFVLPDTGTITLRIRAKWTGGV